MKAPFSQSRWELEGRHLFYLPRKPFTLLEDAKPTYLIGTRGTGKTTLLKALNWSQRLDNPSLQRQLAAHSATTDSFSGRYVGVYFKLPKSHLTSFDRLVGTESRLYHELISMYLDLNWVDLLVEATAGLCDAGIIAFSGDEERQVVRQVADEFEDFALIHRYLGGREVGSLRSLSKGFKQIRQHVERDIQAGTGVEQLSAKVPMSAAPTLSTVAAERLLTLFPADPSAEAWYFLVCMDEGESLTDSQQVALNSLVRIAERPVIPVVAYLSLPQRLVETDGPMTVTRADVDVVQVDDMEDGDFKDFAEGIASVRLQESAGESDIAVSLDELLGVLDINRLLEEILQASSDKWGRWLLAEAAANRDVEYFQSTRSDAPPIYQTYLHHALDLDFPAPESEHWSRRKQHSAEIRKKFVAAYLSICRMVRIEPRYASAGMLLQMCDKCVRDFLWQMNEVYQEAGDAPAPFAAGRVSTEAQHRALRRASEQKMNRVGNFVLAETAAVNRLVNGLGRLTARLQGPTEGQLRSGYAAHLRSSEPGVFRLRAGERLEDHAVAFSLIAEAVDANYLRWVHKADETLRFRVHTSLAPHYGFSYRGAYAEVVLDSKDLRDMYETGEDARLAEVVERLASGRMPVLPDTMPLFEPQDGEWQ